MNIILSIVMLAAFALVAGAAYFWRRTGAIKKPALMVVLALVMVANVLIWTVPDASGEALVEQVQTKE
jgi:hypothetical protein